MKIALIQLDVKAGDPARNVKRMIKYINKAKADGVDIVAFPELCIGGYLVGDMFKHPSFCQDLMSYNEDVLKASEGIGVIWGNVYMDETKRGEDGKPMLFNAAFFAMDGNYVPMVGGCDFLPGIMYIKTLLPNYRFFDDKRYFTSSLTYARHVGCKLPSLIKPFLFEAPSQKGLGLKPYRIGLQLCEDLWCADYQERRESINPAGILTKQGVDLIINLSASPWTIGKNKARDRRIAFIAKECGEEFVPYYYVNATGAQNNGKNIVTFDGGSTVYGKDGKPRCLASANFEESGHTYVHGCLIEDSKRLDIINTLPAAPRDYDETSIEQKRNAIVRGLRHVRHMMKSPSNPNVVLGISGGIDSALVACLLVEAFGKDKVIGVNMPTVNNSEETKSVFKTLVDNLGIEHATIPINEVVKHVKLALRITINSRITRHQKGGEIVPPIVKENIQAKIRSTDILSNLSQSIGEDRKQPTIFTCNGNKVEIALGYATLYGDWGGAVAPIGDLTKAEVYQMARLYQAIPQKLLPDDIYKFGKGKIQPSAELQPLANKQVDPIKVGYHCAIVRELTNYTISTPENLVGWWLDGTLHKKLEIPIELMKLHMVDDPVVFIEDLQWLMGRINGAVYKRVQSPPIIITSKTAYGYDRRESIPLGVPVTRRFEQDLVPTLMDWPHRYQEDKAEDQNQ